MPDPDPQKWQRRNGRVIKTFPVWEDRPPAPPADEFDEPPPEEELILGRED